MKKGKTDALHYIFLFNIVERLIFELLLNHVQI